MSKKKKEFKRNLREKTEETRTRIFSVDEYKGSQLKKEKEKLKAGNKRSNKKTKGSKGKKGK